MTKVWVGINDLATLHPEIAKEADGWDTSKVLSGSSKKWDAILRRDILGILLWKIEPKIKVGKVQDAFIALIKSY